MPNRLNAKISLNSIQSAVTRLGFDENWYLILLGALLGILTGLCAVGFVIALEWVEHLAHDAGRYNPTWLPVVTLFVIPAIGIGLTGVLVHYFAAEAKGHGVPQVMKALIQRGGVIPLRTGIVKTLGSILTVGSGGSAGTEGPIVQIGAVAGSVLGQRLHVVREHMGVLVGCGAAAGIASIFNAPIAGVFFVLEILLRDLSVRVFAPIVIASVFSAVTTQAIRGENEAIFPVSAALHDAQFTPQELPSYVILGALCGLVAVSFNKMLHEGERIYDRVRLHPLLKPITGALLLGLIGTIFYLIAKPGGATGDQLVPPPFYSNGYGTIALLLDPTNYLPGADSNLPIELWLLLLLLVAKALATSITPLQRRLRGHLRAEPLHGRGGRGRRRQRPAVDGPAARRLHAVVIRVGRDGGGGRGHHPRRPDGHLDPL